MAHNSIQENLPTLQFKHTTSSPHYPASNGQAERAVQTVKQLLGKSTDPFIALLSYRSTPLPWCGRSPAELLMGRNIRSTLPQTTESLIPQWPYLSEFRQTNKSFKRKQKRDHDRCHRTQEVPDIRDNTNVWVTTDGHNTSGRTVTCGNTPRSYIVETPNGEVRRNRTQLYINPSDNDNDKHPVTTESHTHIMTSTKTGTPIHPPERLGL